MKNTLTTMENNEDFVIKSAILESVTFLNPCLCFLFRFFPAKISL